MKDLYGIKVIWSNDRAINHFLKSTNKQFDLQTFKKFENIILTGNQSHDNFVLRKFTKQIKILSASPDTDKGYCVTFTNRTKYEDIVSTIDICQLTDNRPMGFILYNNHALVWKSSPYQYLKTGDTDHGGLKMHPIDGYLIHITMPDNPNPNWKLMELIECCKNYIVTIWPSILIFILMLYFTINKKKRYLNLKTFRLAGSSVS